MKVPGVAVRLLETEAPLPEIHLPGNAGFGHPLKRAVNRRPADAMVFLANEVDEIVGAEVPLLAEEHSDDKIALAGAFGAGRAHLLDASGCGRDDLRRLLPS